MTQGSKAKCAHNRVTRTRLARDLSARLKERGGKNALTQSQAEAALREVAAIMQGYLAQAHCVNITGVGTLRPAVTPSGNGRISFATSRDLQQKITLETITAVNDREATDRLPKEIRSRRKRESQEKEV